MSTSVASLALPTLSSRSKSLCYSTSSTQAFFSTHSTSFSLSASKPISISIAASSSRFVSRVALSSSEFVDQEQQDTFSDDPTTSSPDLKLFVGNLPFSVDSAQLAQLFETAGNVEVVEVIYDKVTGRSRGFGFVTMSTPQEVQAATQQFNGYELEGRALRVNSGPPPARKENSPFRAARGVGDGGPPSDTGHRVHVGNLAWGVDHLALETLFREQGKVLEAKVIYDRESGRSRGFGFVTYSTAEEVNSAIESLNGVDVNGRPIRVSLADSKPKRQF